MSKNNNIQFSLDNLKRIAASKLTQIDTFGDLIEYFKIQWCKRYNRPFKDPLILQYTPYELILEILTCDFLDEPQSLSDFIRRDNGETDAIMEDDELWFKEQMGEGYTQDEYRTDEYKAQLARAKKNTGEDIEELPDGEYKF